MYFISPPSYKFAFCLSLNCVDSGKSVGVSEVGLNMF